jgi:glycosyltransferase involved in cell wall biosynthesis
MKCSILGGDGNILCQVPAIREGFAELGYKHIDYYWDNDTSFIFVGNPPYDNLLELARKKEKKIIFNVLDLPFHVKEIDEIINKHKKLLPLASKVTTISKSVQSQLKEYCGIDSDVIYYPMKDVKYTGTKKYNNYKVAIVGRALDPNKRSAAAIKSLIMAGYKEDDIVIVGGENIGYGNYLGVVTDSYLNDIYNSVDYVMFLSKNEGIGLPPIEAATCGAIPIIAPDLTTFDEFWAQSPLGLHYQYLTSIDRISNLIKDINSNEKWKNEIKQDLIGYSELYFKNKFNKKEVAKRIIDVYHSIPN